MTGKPIDGVVQALIEVAVGKVQHLYRGTCPDAIEGFDSRDPQCPACRVLTAAQQQWQAVSMAYTAGPDETHTRQFPLVQQGQAVDLAPPSAPVGVEGFEQWYARVDARFWNNWDACNAAFHAGKRAALAQQPAAPQQPAGRVHDLAARLVDELDGLVGESDGVSGLHLNGDVATWDELLPGGRFERLSSLDELRAALAAKQQGGAA